MGQNPQLSRRHWLGPLLDKEVSLNLLKKLMGNLAFPLRKEVSLTLLQIPRLRDGCPSDKGVALDHLQKVTANLKLPLGAADLAHPPK